MNQKNLHMIFNNLKLRSFGNNIYTGKITINESYKDQSNLLENMVELNEKI